MSEPDPLPDPIRSVIAVPLDEADIARGFSRVQATRGGARRDWRPLIATAATAAVALLVYWAWNAGPPHLEAGPLAVADHVQTVTAGDDSVIAVSAGAALALVTDDATEVVLSLDDGRVDFDIPPNRGRRWRIEAGPTAVQVVGTRFSVRRDGDEVEVEVTRGTVRVTHTSTVELTAGQRWSSTEAAQASEPPEAHLASPAAPGASASHAAPEETTPAAPPPVERPATQAPSERPAPAPNVRADAPPVRPPALSPEARLQAADVARAEGRVEEGLAHLSAAAEAGGPVASVARVTRARWLLELGRVREAAAELDRAERGAAPPALRETLLSLRVQARARLGDRAGAESAAQAYDAAFPHGSFAPENRRWLERVAP